MRRSGRDQQRNLIVVVGPDGEGRTRVAKGLIERGSAVVLCEGPPGCSLVRAQRCPIVDAVDAVVIMPVVGETTREIAFGLTLCARDARRALALEPSVAHMHSEPRTLNSTDPDVVGPAIENLVSRRS